jgi:hypothetical protein
LFIYGKTNKNSYFKYCCIYKFVAVFIFLEKGYKVDNIIIKEASSEDALARIEYSKKIGAETDNLSFGAECFPISVEGEAEYIESLEIINLEVKSDNFRAIHVYEKFGFRKIGTSPAYFKIGDSYIDFDIMYLDLR